MNDFLIVIVIYEIDLKDCSTLSSLINISNVSKNLPEILVYDNSLTSKYDPDYKHVINYYQHDPANSGVAGAYNYAHRLGKERSKNWLVLTDQDSRLPADYMSILQHNINKYQKIKLFSSTVVANSVIVSPTYFVAQKPLPYKQKKNGCLLSKYYTIINSGLAINIGEMESIGGYDPELPLDYSDHYFFNKYKKQNKHFVLLDCEIGHGLSSYTDVAFEKVYERYKKYCLSTFIYARKIGSGLPIFWLIVRALKLKFKFNRREFIMFLVSRKSN